jgi:hypothetical protein
MKQLLALIISSAFASLAFAADPAPANPPKPKTAQQEKMSSCNKQAAGKKGEERKAYMKECLSAKPDGKKAPSAAQLAQRDKMKSCNTDAQSMKGEERKSFMKTCLAK